MVTIIDTEQRVNSENEPFNALILEGDLETVESANGKVYFTARKASVPSNFSDEKCQSLIGKQLPGKVKKVPCDPYEYITEGGEVLMLSHTYVYDPNPASQEEEIFSEDEQIA